MINWYGLRGLRVASLAGIVVFAASACEGPAGSGENQAVAVDSTEIWREIEAAEANPTLFAYENYESIPISAGAMVHVTTQVREIYGYFNNH
jgi:hypothetical protein